MNRIHAFLYFIIMRIVIIVFSYFHIVIEPWRVDQLQFILGLPILMAISTKYHPLIIMINSRYKSIRVLVYEILEYLLSLCIIARTIINCSIEVEVLIVIYVLFMLLNYKYLKLYFKSESNN